MSCTTNNSTFCAIAKENTLTLTQRQIKVQTNRALKLVAKQLQKEQEKSPRQRKIQYNRMKRVAHFATPEVEGVSEWLRKAYTHVKTDLTKDVNEQVDAFKLQVSELIGSAPEGMNINLTISELLIMVFKWNIQTPHWCVAIADILLLLLHQIPKLLNSISTKILGVIQQLLKAKPTAQDNQLAEVESSIPSKVRDTTINMILALADSVLGSSDKNKTPRARLSLLGKEISALSQGVRGVMQFSKWIMDIFATRIYDFYEDLCIRFVERKNPNAPDFRKLIQLAHEIKQWPPEHIGTTQSQATMREAIQLTALVDHYMFDKQCTLSNGQRTLIRDSRDAIHKIYQSNLVSFNDTTDIMRETPYVVQLVGAPGCGKSDILPLLLDTVCLPQICGRAIPKDTFAYSATKYMDGFKGQDRKSVV